MGRYSDPSLNKERKRSQRQAERPSSVVYSYEPSIKLAARHNTAPKGGHINYKTKAKNFVGDKRQFHEHEYVAFKGGEGGRNWSVPSTLS